ncbi:MAG: sigma-70 family RNA polymerase sigma factor [Planctomycetes bacterium]|nr:sigma-70 family RNA polymerase sigma factor [Planctomycetota bacterium]
MSDDELKTSRTFLGQLRVFGDKRAWARFHRLYLPLIETWAAGYGLPKADVDDLTGRLLLRFVRVVGDFRYDPAIGRFRGWLKTLTIHEIANLARERRRQLPGHAGLGHADVYDMLLQHAENPDRFDGLADGLSQRSEDLLGCFHRAMNETKEVYSATNEESWAAFERVFIKEEALQKVASDLALTYHAIAMRVTRIKKKVKARALELAVQQGLISAAAVS